VHIEELLSGRTNFVIAHRLNTIRNADPVLVLNQGENIEQGTHDVLLKAGGFYHDLYMSQFRYEAAQENAAASPSSDDGREPQKTEASSVGVTDDN